MNTDTSAGIVENIMSQVAEYLSSPANDNAMPAGPEPAYGQALVGLAAGNDPLWLTFKDAVHPEHWTPLEAFELAFADQTVAVEDVSVLAVVLPHTEKTRTEQRRQMEFAGESWIRNRYRAQQTVVEGLARYLQAWLAEQGIRSLNPEFLLQWGCLSSPRFGIASRWSHRHAAFAAGLGTFGLSEGLITPVGKAMRCLSLVIGRALKPTPRNYTGPYDYCLHNANGACGKCINRCPAGAISGEGHDKIRCQDYLKKTVLHVATTWPDIAGAYACGLCQSGVPCESRVPMPAARSILLG